MSHLIKQPSESRLYQFEFAALLQTGETISSVTSVVASVIGLTLGTPAISGTKVQVRISGGTANVYYKITAIIMTGSSNILEAEGVLHVIDL